MKARERKSDIDFELESEDPTDLDDMVFSEEEESREVVVTSVEHRDPTATSAGEEEEATWHAGVPVLRKRGVSTDTVGGWATKRTWSPCPSVVSPIPSSSMVDATEKNGRSEERTSACTAMGPVPTPDS